MNVKPRPSTTRQPVDTAARTKREAPASDGATVGELTYHRIRSDIVLGRLPPGHRLPLDRMRDAYGASVSTLRELLARLASEGLLIAEASRGFEVPRVSIDELREIAAMRELLECHAMRQSFTKGDVEWEAGVVAAHHLLTTGEAKLAAGQPYPPETWRRYDYRFHRALIAACGSRLLLETHASICDKFLRYQMIAAVFRGKVTADEHRLLLECALARDWRRAQAALGTHLADCVEQMTSAISAQSRAE